MDQIDSLTELFYELLENATEYVTNSERNLAILAFRFGLQDRNSLSLQEIGNLFNLSRERIRQIEKRTLQKIKLYGNRQLQNNNHEHACAKLLTFIRMWINPGDISSDCNMAILAIRLSDIPSYRLFHIFTNLSYSKDEVSVRSLNAERLYNTLRSSVQERHRIDRRQQQIFQRLFKDVAWPQNFKNTSIDDFLQVHPKRSVNHDSESISGSFYSKKNEANIEYESQLEFHFCKYLEELEYVSNYVQQPMGILYTISEVIHDYCPDFLVRLNDGRCIVVEIKPHMRMGYYSNIMKWIGLQNFCQKEGYGYLIIENSRNLNDYICAELDQKKVEFLLFNVNDRVLYWSDYKKLREEVHLSWSELNSIILQHNLKFTSFPFRLELSPFKFSEFIRKHKKMTGFTESPNTNMLVTSGQEKAHLGTRKKHKIKQKENSGTATDPTLSNSYNRWEWFEDEQLRMEFYQGMELEQMASVHKRKTGGIHSRLKKLGLISE